MACIVVGYDGSELSLRALDHAKELARLIGDCQLALAFVIEWSPYSFHTPEELEQRHKRREQELIAAREKVLEPAAAAIRADGFEVVTEIGHGDGAQVLDDIARRLGANQIVIGRTGHRGLRERLFGGLSGNLVATATVPVTIIP